MRGAPAAAARLLVAASLPGAAAALAAAALGRPFLHARLVSLYTLPVFITGVAVAYAASPLRGALPPPALAALASVLPASLAALALGPLPLAAASLASAASALWAATRTRGSVALSLYGLGVAYAAYSAVLLLAPRRGLLWLLASVYALAVGSIYGVSFHSFPRTYRLQPRPLAGLAAYAANAAGSLLLPRVAPAAALLLASGLLLYPLAARLDALPRLLPEALRGRRLGAAGRSHCYFTVGHVFALIGSLLSAAGLAGYALGGGVVSAIHTATIGFVLVHIEIHAPMMVPVILGLRHARRYNAAAVYPPALAAALLMAARVAASAALLLVSASLAAALFTAWPAGARGGRS